MATGHFEPTDALQVGDRVEIGGHAGIVRAVEPLLGEQEQRLVIQLLLNGQSD